MADKKVGGQIEEFMKLVMSGKATAIDKIKLSQLLQQNAEAEAKIETQEKLEKVANLVKELELNPKDVIEFLSGPKEVLIRWNDNGIIHERVEGDTVIPKWLKELKQKISSLEMEKLIVATSLIGKEKAKLTIKKLYEK